MMYESLDAASAALSEMKGYPLGGADHRITVDFADPGKAGKLKELFFPIFLTYNIF